MKEHLINLPEAESNLLSTATYLAENIKSSDGQAEAMKEIVAHYIAKGDVDLAAQLADLIEDTFIRDRLLCDVAEKCAALDDDEYAFQLADAIEDNNFQSVARERIAAQKASKNDFAKAFEIVETLPHPSDALADIAIHQSLGGNDTEALRTVEQIEFHASKVIALQAIAAHFQSLGDKEKANELLTKAVEEAEEIEFAEEKIRALVSIAAHYIAGGQPDRAIEILADARNVTETLQNTHRDNLLTLISMDFLRAGSIDLADRTLDLVADKTLIASCLTSFAAEFDARGESAEALEALEEAYAILKSQKDKEIRDSRARFGVFGTVAVRFAALEKPERAVEIALENPIEEERSSALTQIARICALKENGELSRQALSAIKEDSSRIFALIAVSDAENKLEKKDEALRYLSEARALADTLAQPSVRTAALNEIIKRFSEYGETEKAREASLANLQSISRILDESHRAIALSRLSAVYEASGFEPNDAEKSILRTMLRKSEW